MATNDTQFSEGKTDRSMRLLQMFDRLQRGSGISTKALQQEFGITAKSVQRDIGELRVYIAEAYTPSVYGNIEYNRIRKEYYWRNRSDMLLHEKEILLLVTILLESRGLTKEELNRLVDKMLVQCIPESEKHSSVSGASPWRQCWTGCPMPWLYLRMNVGPCCRRRCIPGEPRCGFSARRNFWR